MKKRLLLAWLLVMWPLFQWMPILPLAARPQQVLPMIGSSVAPAAAGGPSLKGTWALSNAYGGATCNSPCTVTLNQSAAVGDSIVILASTNVGNFTCADNGSSGGNTYTVDQHGAYSGCICYSINVSKTATTVTVTNAVSTASQYGVMVVSGATAQDGANKWATISSTTFATASLTPSANGLALGFVEAYGSNILPVAVASPWANSVGAHTGGAPKTIANVSGWVLSVTDEATTSGSATTLSGTTTTNNAAEVGMIGLK